jgi:transposase-like protein
MTKPKQYGAFSRHRFPPEIIAYAVWAYHRFPKSLRDVEDLLAARGVVVSYATIRAWVVLVPFTFRTLNSFMRPFAQKPRDFSRRAMSGDGAGYRTR